MNTLGNRRHSIIDGLEPDIKETVVDDTCWFYLP